MAKIEGFWTILDNEMFSLEDLVSEDGKESNKLTELLWYLDKSRSKVVTEQLKDVKSGDEARYQAIVRNLAHLYPLSQYLVKEILLSIETSDNWFILGFDEGEEVKGAIKGILDQIETRSGEYSELCQQYQKSIERLEQRAATLKERQSGLKELGDKMHQLQKEVEKLETEANEQRLQKAIENLEREKLLLENDRQRQRDRQERLTKSIQDIAHELEESKAKFASQKEQELLRELLGHFPNDAEENP